MGYNLRDLKRKVFEIHSGKKVMAFSTFDAALWFCIMMQRYQGAFIRRYMSILGSSAANNSRLNSRRNSRRLAPRLTSQPPVRDG
jgi:hypothetical protein